MYLVLSCHSPHFISHAQAGWLAKGDAREYVSCAMRLLQLYGIVVTLKGIRRAECVICFCQSTTAVSSTHPAATVEAVAVVRYCWVLDPPYHQVYTVTNRHTSSGGISELGEVSNGITKDILFENLYQNIV